MATGSYSSRAVALVLAQTLWVLPGGQQAWAQQVTLPENLISQDVPHDVPAGGACATEPFAAACIQELAIFAWQEFIALNWVAQDPATSGIRGRPAPFSDPNTGFLDIAPDATGSYPLLVWQTYRHKNELFPADGTTPMQFDSRTPTYDYANNPRPGTGVNGQVPKLNLFNNLDETSQIGLANMYAHSSATPPNSDPASGIRIAYEAKVNRAVYQYIVDNGLTNETNLSNAYLATGPIYGPQNIPNVGICKPPAGVSLRSIILLPCGDNGIAGDAGEGAIEVKAAWRALTTDEVAKGRFYMRNVIYYTGQSSPPPLAPGQKPQVFNNAVWGLVALHIIHKTKSFPAFVFASWEQVDNYDDVTPANSQNLAFHNVGDAKALADIPVTRNHAINSPIPPVNDAVHAVFTDPTTGNPKTVWQYYKLIGVQATPVNGPPPATATPDELSYYYMANLMVETNQVLQNFTGSVDSTLNGGKQINVYVNGDANNPYQMGGCQGCHGFQGQYLGGDMSVLIANGYSNTVLPESIDANDATSIRTYRRRVLDARQRTGVSLRHYFPLGAAHSHGPDRPNKSQ